MDADTVIVAIGQSPDLPTLSGMDIAPNGVVVDPDSLATSVPGVFAGGDAVVGAEAGTVVEAIAAGKRAARSIDSYLRGLELGKSPGAAWEVAEDMVPRFVEKRSRRPEPLLPRAERTRSSQVVELAYSRKDAVEEARRCLNCSMCGNCMFDHIQMCHETGSRLL